MLGRLKIQDWLFIILLVAGLAVRTGNFFPFDNYDEIRDYRAAEQIVQSGRYPDVGPPHSVYGSGFNSPWYYYFLSVFLRIEDSLFTLRILNMFLQLISIIALYLLAREMFGAGCALGTAGIYLFSILGLFQSHYLWQSHIMFPFVNFSFLFLWLAYSRMKLFWLCLSLVSFVFASAMHTPILLLTPAFAVLVLAILISKRAKIVDYFLSAETLFAAILVLFGPVIVYRLNNPNTTVGLAQAFHSISPAVVWEKFTHILSILANSIFLNARMPGLSATNILIVVLLASAVVYFYKQQGPRRIYAVILAGLIIQHLLAATLPGSDISLIHLAPVFGLTMILMSEVISAVFSGGKYLNAAKLVLFFWLIAALSQNFAFIKGQQFRFYPDIRWLNLEDYRF